ncbi:MAG TPA: hypothetical protein VMZ28_15400 [Kofleriaceae bacterium]|nr:hypothetical protein [Kofleriaceae bacterium]
MRWLLFFVAAAGCGGDLLGNEGFEILCGDQPCDWKLVEGEAAYAGSWHDGDPGVDLSGAGRAVIEQRSAPFALDTRELVLSAGVARDGTAMRFELEWYVAGQETGATYWDRAPVRVDTRTVPVDDEGVFALEELVSTPSLEVSGLVLRVIKEGNGMAVIDQVTLTEPGVLP